MEDWELYGFIREDSNKYYLRNLAGEEGLIYDFSVNIGDTITINNPFGFMPVDATVTNIDSIFIEPGNEYRKRITLFEYEDFWNEEYWIEGIGSLAGITESSWDMTLLTGGDDYTLLCYFEDDEFIYKDAFYPSCFYQIVSVVTNDYVPVASLLFPNPVIDKSTLIFDGADKKDLTVKIIDITGKLIEHIQITTPAEIKINSGKLKKGFYIYHVYEESRIIASEKFVVL